MDLEIAKFELQCNDRLKKYLELARPFYRDNVNFYHTFDHIKDCFHKFIQNEAMFDEQFSDYDTFHDYNKDVLFWAIAFHDAFYMPGFNANEEISYDIYSATMVQNSLPVNSYVATVILSTSFINTKYHTPCKKIMHDLDYSCFISVDELKNAEEKIYNEYIAINLKEDDDINRNFFTEKRIKFYQTILNRLNNGTYMNKELFYTAPFSRYNYHVRDIIKERISDLENFKKS